MPQCFKSYAVYKFVVMWGVPIQDVILVVGRAHNKMELLLYG